jgi:hypothetical protein
LLDFELSVHSFIGACNGKGYKETVVVVVGRMKEAVVRIGCVKEGLPLKGNLSC